MSSTPVAVGLQRVSLLEVMGRPFCIWRVVYRVEGGAKKKTGLKPLTSSPRVWSPKTEKASSDCESARRSCEFGAPLPHSECIPKTKLNKRSFVKSLARAALAFASSIRLTFYVEY